MSLNFDQAITVGRASDMVERTRGKGVTTPRIPKSGILRGLTIKSLRITSSWDSVWSFLGRRQQIYFLSVAFDLSGQEPIIFPPSTVSADTV